MITVIIPTFNRERTIKRAIDSVLNQTYKNLEIIVVDDCSTDNTEVEVKTYKDKRIKYIKLEKNYGACYARNIGIDMAKGEYIAFQDSDDEWSTDKLQTQIDNLKKNNSDIDFCSIIIDNKNIFPNKQQKQKIKKFGLKKTLLYGNFISTQAVLGRTSCFKNEKFDNDLLRLQDYELMIRMSRYLKISYTNKILVNVFKQSDSIGNDNKKLIQANLRIMKKDYNLNSNEKSIFIAKRMESMGDAYKGEKDFIMAKEYYIKSLREKIFLKVLKKIIYFFYIKKYFNIIKAGIRKIKNLFKKCMSFKNNKDNV